MKDSFENILISSRRSATLIETDHRNDFLNEVFTDVLNKNNNKRFSTNTSLGVVFAERFDRTIEDLNKNPVFRSGDGNWLEILPTITKQGKTRTQFSTKMTPLQASLKKDEGPVYKFLLEKRTRIKTKFKIHDLIRTADLKRTFSKGDTTIKYYKLYEITESINEKCRVIALTIYQKDIMKLY